MKMLNRIFSVPGTVALSAFCSVSAYAADPTPATIDFNTLISQIHWDSVITAILTIAGGIAVLNLAMAGSKHILSFIKRG